MKKYQFLKSNLLQNQNINELFLQYLKNDSNIGVIKSIIDGVVIIEGLSSVKAGEMLQFSNDIQGMALNLNSETVSLFYLVMKPKLNLVNMLKELEILLVYLLV